MLVNNKGREYFRQMISICYDEDYPELHEELVSLERETKRNKNGNKYSIAVEQLIEAINIYTEDFPEETYRELEEIYIKFLENE